MGRKGYRLLDHTADLRLEVKGDSFEDLLACTVGALTRLAYGEVQGPATEEMAFVLDLDEPDMMFFRLVDQYLYIVEARGLVPVEAQVRRGQDRGLHIRLGCLPSAQLPGPRVHIKAPTLHGFELGQSKDGMYVRLVLDT